MEWSAERILAFAPDASSAKAGQGLAHPRKWVRLGRNERALWGECQGSAAKPYQVQIDLSEPAFKCSCPSHKFPCKHALGLFLILGGKSGADAPPAWVADWIASRDAKREKKKEKAEKGTAPVDPSAQAQRAAERHAKITAGMVDVSRWMTDLVRQGLAQAQSAGEAFWEQASARLVDAQAPGAARMVREMGALTHSGEGWQDRVLVQLGRLFLLTQAWSRLDRLPPDLQADARAMAGIPVREEELQQRPVVSDTWCVVAQRTEDEDLLRTQRSWLLGQNCGRAALVLEFSYGGQPLGSQLSPGINFAGDLVFYPGSYPLRVAIRMHRGDAREVERLSGYAGVAEALAAYAAAVAANPWLHVFPMLLNAVRPVRRDRLFLADAAGQMVPVTPRFAHGWAMSASGGGRPLAVFGEWDGRAFAPMSVLGEEGYYGFD